MKYRGSVIHGTTYYPNDIVNGNCYLCKCLKRTKVTPIKDCSIGRGKFESTPRWEFLNIRVSTWVSGFTSKKGDFVRHKYDNQWRFFECLVKHFHRESPVGDSVHWKEISLEEIVSKNVQ